MLGFNSSIIYGWFGNQTKVQGVDGIQCDAGPFWFYFKPRRTSRKIYGYVHNKWCKEIQGLIWHQFQNRVRYRDRYITCRVLHKCENKWLRFLEVSAKGQLPEKSRIFSLFLKWWIENYHDHTHCKQFIYLFMILTMINDIFYLIFHRTSI
mgnify:CR=1 FL=1